MPDVYTQQKSPCLSLLILLCTDMSLKIFQFRHITNFGESVDITSVEINICVYKESIPAVRSPFVARGRRRKRQVEGFTVWQLSFSWPSCIHPLHDWEGDKGKVSPFLSNKCCLSYLIFWHDSSTDGNTHWYLLYQSGYLSDWKLENTLAIESNSLWYPALSCVSKMIALDCYLWWLLLVKKYMWQIDLPWNAYVQYRWIT